MSYDYARNLVGHAIAINNNNNHVRPYDVTINKISNTTVLDPRFKLAYCTADENSTDHVSTDEVFEKVDSVLRRHYQPSAAACDLETTNATKEGVSSSTALQLKKFMFKKPKLSVPSSEFKCYCDAPTVDESVLPLEWWKVNASLYPNLSRMARAYLGIPGTPAH